MVSRTMIVTALVAVIMAVLAPSATMGFAPQTSIVSKVSSSTTTSSSLFVFGKKKDDDFDISSIETRDMTRAEMQEYNRRSEEIMNNEMNAMTAFSLVISLPILYLCWVAFFSD